MAKISLILLYVFIIKIYVICAGHLWHSYQFDGNHHRNREELVITNVTSDENFKIDLKVEKWHGERISDELYISGLLLGANHTKLAVASIYLNEENNFKVKKSKILSLGNRITDFKIIDYWNATAKESTPILVVATNKPELIWYQIQDFNFVEFWSWPLVKNLTHLNIFQIDHSYHILLINDYHNNPSADLYEFELKRPNFWLQQSLKLSDPASSSAISKFNRDYFISIPQKSLKSLLVFKSSNLVKFVPFRNLTSYGIDEVISFEIGFKSFIAFNGVNAGIYKFTKSGLIREDIIDSHLHSVNTWVQFHFSDDFMLLAQRTLTHGLHEAFVVEVLVYNGAKFEEHEDIACNYFGEFSTDLSCLEEDSRGVSGAIGISLSGRNGLLVPRNNGNSELFIFNTTIRKKTNPVEIEIKLLKERMAYLDNLVKDQERNYEELELENNETDSEIRGKSRQAFDENDFTSLLDDLQIEVHFIDEEIGKLNSTIEKIQKFENRTNYHEIIFKGPVEIQGNSTFRNVQTDTINGEPTELILTDLVLKNKLKNIESPKIFKDLNVDDLNFDEINNKNSRDLIFKSDDNEDVVINGNMKVNKPLAVLGGIKTSKLNGANLSTSENNRDGLKFESIEVLGELIIERLNKIELGSPNIHSELDGSENLDLEFDSLTIPKNILVGKVNNQNFDDFLKQICMKNIDTFIPGPIQVSGDILMGRSGVFEQINELKFPSDFVFGDESGSVISGRKIFNNSLEVSEVYCEGLDGVKINEMVTLRTSQNLTGRFIFKNLEVSESLDIKGKVSGEDVSKFLPNPTILETKKIESKINFRDLEVKGSIILSERFNGRDLGKILDDLIYQDEEQVEIIASKLFPQGFTTNQMKIFTNSINNFTLDSIITKDSAQLMNVSFINAEHVTFKNLNIGGLYNQVNVTDLDQNLVKLTGEQFVSSTLIFNNSEDLQLEGDLTITKTLNGRTPEDYFYEKQLIQIVNNSMKLEEISARNIEILGDFEGDIENFNLEVFNKQRLSFTGNQEIPSDFSLNQSKVHSLKTIGTINNMSSDILTNQDTLSNIIVENLILGKYKIKEMEVDGSIKIGEINGEDAINLGGILNNNGFERYNLKNITFEDLVQFEKPLSINSLSGQGFNDYLDAIVYKNSTNPQFTHPKLFKNGLKVRKYIETKKLNDVEVNNILTKYGEQKIQGPILVEGDVYFEDLDLTKTLNEMSMDLMENNYKFENSIKLTMKGDVLFERLVHIFDLQVRNNSKIQDILESIIYKNQDFNLTDGLITFENNVQMNGNLRVINNINNLDLTQFVSNVVMTSKDLMINGPLRFTQPIKIRESLNLDGNLDTEGFTNGVDLKKWSENAIFIDKGILGGNFTFEHGVIVENLNTRFLNNKNMSNLINLRSKEQLPHLKFEDVNALNGIQVGNLINDFNLQEEFSNTLLGNLNQTISSQIIFNKRPKLERGLEITGKLNGKPVDKIVTTSTDQNLSAIYNFKSKISMDRGLITTGFINGINVTSWDMEAVKLWMDRTQEIDQPWSGPGSEITFKSEVSGDALINGIELGLFQNVLEIKRNYKYEMERNYIDNYNKICKDLNYMHGQIKNQIYKFNYLENLQMLTFEKYVQYSYNFQFKNNHFLIVNEEKSCISHILVWIKTQFQAFKDVVLGQISQIITTIVDDKFLLIIRNEKAGCEFSESTHVWSFDGNTFQILLKIDGLNLLQDSLIPGTFYAIQHNEEVAEFQINPNVEPLIRKYRKWNVNAENMVFVPRGLSTGLAISTGTELIKLERNEPEVVDLPQSYEIEAVILGNFTKALNIHLPGFDKSQNCVVMIVGTQSSKRKLLALASFEETSIKGSLDFIKIYEDAASGKLFQKLPAYKPSTLITLNFDNGETLLAFLEDSSILQVYEYKGIEGFKHKFSTKLDGWKLFEMSLSLAPYKNERKVIGIIDKNRIGFLEAMMLGNQIKEDLRCML